jgi:hypothetical protein
VRWGLIYGRSMTVFFHHCRLISHVEQRQECYKYDRAGGQLRPVGGGNGRQIRACKILKNKWNVANVTDKRHYDIFVAANFE